jgi:fermentation-respiration switch protein FrsA (DUF1100 family)
VKQPAKRRGRRFRITSRLNHEPHEITHFAGRRLRLRRRPGPRPRHHRQRTHRHEYQLGPLHFPLSDKVTRQKVTFVNRYGIRLTADLYLPKGQDGQKLPALAVGGPFGAVKEQSSGLYANTMAARGFVAIAFDPSYTGESGGEPRNIASPDINTEDFSAAVDFLGLQPFVDRNRIGIIGICGWGSMALNATAVDKRIKTVVTSTMYDMTRVMSKGYNDSVTLEQRTQTLERLSQQRWVDAENGKPAYQPPYNDLKGGEAQFLVDYHDYYRTPRG